MLGSTGTSVQGKMAVHLRLQYAGQYRYISDHAKVKWQYILGYAGQYRYIKDHAKVKWQYILGYVRQYIRDHGKVMAVHLRLCRAVHQ
jgi:hypothetical protein